MNRPVGSRRNWVIFTVALTMLAWGFALPAGASTRATAASLPCPGIPQTVKLGTTTPALLVHGFNEGPGVFTSGSPSLVNAITETLGDAVTPLTFDYHMANTEWVTNAAIGPQLAQCIIWLASTSAEQGGPGKVVIVAHSMGGLAVRCAVDPSCVSGKGKGPAASPNLIGLVITLGTPNLGSNPQTLGPVGNTVCSWFPVCNSLLILRATPAAKAMVADSKELSNLAPLPATIPVDAIAGKITFTTNLFGSVFGGIDIGVGDDGDIVVPVNSALAEAPSGTAHAGPGANSTTVDCGSIPLDQLASWSAASLAAHTPAPPVTCWHLTETTNPVWQGDITTAIRAATASLSLRACTPAAIDAALIVRDLAKGSPYTLVAYACEAGWAVVWINQPLTVNNGTVVQNLGVTVLKQTPSGWTSEGLNDGVCLAASPACPGYELPPPEILKSLLQKTSNAEKATEAELYINTIFTPGALYAYPSGPSKIGLSNSDYIDNLTWMAGSQGDLVGTGTLHHDTCNPGCAAGTYVTYQVQIVASDPQRCSVRLYPNGFGNSSQIKQAEVFDMIDVRALQGSPPSYETGYSVLPGPCT